MKRISYILLALLAVACGGANKQTSEPQEAVVENKDSVVVYEHDYLVKVGDLAPDFTLNYTDGNEFTLSQLRGKVVMLQFTASWCGICRNEMPHIESDIWQRHKDNTDFVLVGVDREESKEVVEAYTKKLGTTYPMLLDDKGDVFASYAVRKSGITRNVLIDRDGRIVMLTRRYVEPEFKQLVATIDSLLAK
ncbi:MAG: TlpA family protein disulfide reductase [Bacteroidaceae bacterium]|jgi:peroxiredoxin|nr:TlpA family protein disulfide reductase [Bacteroidaceae bacterium]